jgi:hypothetical protein
MINCKSIEFFLWNIHAYIHTYSQSNELAQLVIFNVVGHLASFVLVGAQFESRWLRCVDPKYGPTNFQKSLQRIASH